MYQNGTILPAGSPIAFGTIAGVRSVIPEEEYKVELEKKHFREKTPVDFNGYNSGSFPFWSSEPFTYASAMLALT